MTSQTKAPKELLKAQKWANMLDTAIKLPVINFRVGLDSIVGLIPGVGDALMLFAGFRIIRMGQKLGMPNDLIKVMVRNSVLDFGLGFIPFIGDVADFFYKSNSKNVQIMERWWIENNKAAVDASAREQFRDWEEKFDS
ncbi:DUF4112 domain-containing protein [Alteromonas confluentis]|uniref:DUF4112 domain-containing protein n=1 Tax=Alteromonas confluentis TaxID=1656094 RepID=A0A1E7Z9I6_9ALTE|nr:DUF4112 domain-containing protein [Alteromonas confluentis]OFC70137.1 hypothetical protein BFC18_13170 [Alteromonas confluentis]